MIRDLQKKLQNTSCVELTQEFLKKIHERDDIIQAFLSVREQKALEEARECDTEAGKNTVLRGIPGAVKDNICLEGEVATAGSKILEKYVAPYDATVIKRLRKAGAIIVGKTNMDEFACGSSTENSAFQTTKNPVATDRVAGGSSGGSAAAVAAGMAAFALGSDTGGSIRQPAALCGVVGFKPTYGRISRHGLMAMASSLDQIGTFTHSVEDAAILLSVLTGEDPLDATCAPLPSGKPFEEGIKDSLKGVRIGVPEEYFPESLDTDIRKLLEEKLQVLKEGGAEIVSIRLPHTKYALPTYYIIQPAEVSSNLARFDGIRYGQQKQPEATLKDQSMLLGTYYQTRGEYLGSEVKRRIMLGTHALSSGYYDAFYQKAQKVRALLKKDFERAFEEVDVIFSPTTPDVAFKIGEKEDPLAMYLSDVYTVTANLVGVPAISVPVGTKKVDNVHLPVGGQIMGKWFDEETVLKVAYHLESAK